MLNKNIYNLRFVNDNMGWKNWPMWLKGGVIGGVVGLFLSIINIYYYFLPSLVGSFFKQLLIDVLIGFIFGALFGKIIGLKKTAAWIKGLMIGIVLAVANLFVFGVLGIVTFFPQLSSLLRIVGENGILVNCSGESCLGALIVEGSIGFIVEGVIIGWIVGKIKRR